MTDRDLAAKPRRFGPSRDFLNLRDALQTAVMQVNIDADAMPLRDAKDDVEMAGGVSIVVAAVGS